MAVHTALNQAMITHRMIERTADCFVQEKESMISVFPFLPMPFLPPCFLKHFMPHPPLLYCVLLPAQPRLHV